MTQQHIASSITRDLYISPMMSKRGETNCSWKLWNASINIQPHKYSRIVWNILFIMCNILYRSSVDSYLRRRLPGKRAEVYKGICLCAQCTIIGCPPGWLLLKVESLIPVACFRWWFLMKHTHHRRSQRGLRQVTNTAETCSSDYYFEWSLLWGGVCLLWSRKQKTEGCHAKKTKERILS
jgi:hypothetical protein